MAANLSTKLAVDDNWVNYTFFVNIGNIATNMIDNTHLLSYLEV